MGLIANYSCLSDANLKELKAMGSEEEEILESVEEWNDDDELLLDIDKMWDVLHFVLTGVGTDHKDDNNPLSQAVLGVMAVEDIRLCSIYRTQSFSQYRGSSRSI